MTGDPYGCIFSLDKALEAVRAWCGGTAFVLTEIGGLEEGRRIDAILVPCSKEHPIFKANPTNRLYFWDRPGLIGVEIKLSRSDFLRGLKNNQYLSYAENFAGVYVAAPRDAAKTSEIPAEIGHLIIANRPEYGPLAVCRRHPKWRSNPMVTGDLFWKIIFRLNDAQREDHYELGRQKGRLEERIGALVARAIFAIAERQLEFEDIPESPEKETK